MIPGIVAGRPVAAGPFSPIALDIYNKVTSWWEMDEASGTRADSKGSNHVSVVGTVSTATGARGGGDTAAAFAGAGGLVAADDVSLDTPSGGGDHCFFGWAYTDSATGNQALGSKWNGLNAGGMDYQIDVQSGGTARAINGISSYYIASQTRPSAAAWHFYIMWRDSTAGTDAGKVRLQINNGTVSLSTSPSNPNGSSVLGFGQVGSTTGQRLTGRLQRWGWIKGAILTPTERAWLYNSGGGRTWPEILAAAGI